MNLLHGMTGLPLSVWEALKTGIHHPVLNVISRLAVSGDSAFAFMPAKKGLLNMYVRLSNSVLIESTMEMQLFMIPL